ncbi:DoxX family protein [Allonocardiopsis opalescens]|uniref:DoxX-like protein n=1 Tax=Allonocardiopsis opalescens TaxID=1144618 RepID=A0A2T0Q583_9ACTN|nr:DoxX family protein [Allonocardiopsis opalescens]PRX98956.1 DoxX-like protein [Allonocardiopsis opalescens]
MNLALWITAGLLAVLYLASGAAKLARSRERLAAWGFAWVQDAGGGTVRAIGVLELLAAAGLVLPAALGIAPGLVPVAALGLVLLMTGAIAVHLRRREYQGVAVSAVLLALAAFVVWGRFALEPFTG